jgi:hypothetical protein
MMLIGLTVAFLALVGMVLLPQDKYIRYKALNDGVTSTAAWVYARIHYDSTPINIAFIGDSRTGGAISTKQLETALAAEGVHVKAANLHIVGTGRNLQYVVAKELLESRKVDLLILEMTELEDRKPHDNFIFLADSEDILLAPPLINFHYLSDVARLPGRQLDLFLQSFRSFSGKDPAFSFADYAGSDLETAEAITDEKGVTHTRDTIHSAQKMDELKRLQEAKDTPAVLPHSLEWLEYHLPRYYIDSILALAASKGTRVVFLYLPRYGAPSEPPPYVKLYASRVPLINPWHLIQEPQLWYDVPHVNWMGAQRITDYLAKTLIRDGFLKSDVTSQTGATAGAEGTPDRKTATIDRAPLPNPARDNR